MSTQRSIVSLLGAVGSADTLVCISAGSPRTNGSACPDASGHHHRSWRGQKNQVYANTAQATIGVEVVKPTVKEASTEATRLMNALMDVLEQMKIAEKDIQTSSFSVWLERPYNQDGTYGDLASCQQPGQCDDPRVGQGWRCVGCDDGSRCQQHLRGHLRACPTPARWRPRRVRRQSTTRVPRLRCWRMLTGLVLGGGGQCERGHWWGGTGGYYSSNLQPASAGRGGGDGGPILPGEMEINVQWPEIVYSTVQ